MGEKPCEQVHPFYIKDIELVQERNSDILGVRCSEE